MALGMLTTDQGLLCQGKLTIAFLFMFNEDVEQEGGGGYSSHIAINCSTTLFDLFEIKIMGPVYHTMAKTNR